MDYNIKQILDYNKIIVIGCSASGKSWFSKKLSAITNIPCYHLDMLYWKPNWTTTPREEFLPLIENIMQNDKWIIDGNYAGTMEARLQKADIVYFLDVSTETCLQSEISRRGQKRSDLPDYLEEAEDPEFIEFIKNFKNKNRNIIMELLQKYPNVKVITFTAREQVNEFFDNICK